MKEPKDGSARWVLVPDEEDPRRLVWEWSPSAADDLDELFARVRNHEGTDKDHQQFDGAMLDRFISRVYAGEPVEPWIMRALADAFYKVLMGSEWNDELRLPGRPVTPAWPWREERDLRIYCDVANAILDGAKVTDAIEQAAVKASVSFETARAAYYCWRDKLSKKHSDS